LETGKHKLAVEDDPKEIEEAILAIQGFRKRKKKVMKVDKAILDDERVDITLFLLKHELPFSLSSPLTEFMKNQVSKYGEEAVKQVTLSDKTAATIARETLCRTVKERLFQDMQSNLFSLSFDGGSDGYGPSYLCTHVRFIKDGQYHHRLLALNEIGMSYTGEALFAIVENIFDGSKSDLLKRNLVGVCTDEGSNMSGSEKGLARLKDKYPQIIDVIMKHALEKYCKEPISLVTKICAYFSKSSLRRAKFREIQEIFTEGLNVDVLNVLSYVETRWTSLYNSINRILVLWESLENYFSEFQEDSPPLTTKNRLYLELLSCLLQRLNSHIEFFENDNRDYSTFIGKLSESLILTSQLILKKEKLNTSTRENHIDSIIQLPFKQKTKIQTFVKDIVTFKADFRAKYPDLCAYSQELSSEEIDECYTAAKDFLLAVYRMVDKFPFKKKILQNCQIIKLEEDEFTQNSFDKWMELGKQFNNIIQQTNSVSFSNELESFEFNYKSLQASYKEFKIKISNNLKLPSQHLIQFWESMRDSYPFITAIAFACLTLPYSTISIERTFSALRDIKYSKRNRLCATGVEACLMMHQVTNQVSNFEVDEKIRAQYKLMWHQDQQKNAKSHQEKGVETQEEVKSNSPTQITLSECNFDYTREESLATQINDHNDQEESFSPVSGKIKR